MSVEFLPQKFPQVIQFGIFFVGICIFNVWPFLRISYLTISLFT